MHGRVRRFAAAVCVATLILGSALPAASVTTHESELALEHIDPLADLMVLRPLGFVALGVGAALFVPVAPLALVTRPDGIPMVFNRLIVAPAKYVWADPLGTH